MVYLFVIISYPSTQFEELYGSFVNLGVHQSPKDNSPLNKAFVSFDNPPCDCFLKERHKHK